MHEGGGFSGDSGGSSGGHHGGRHGNNQYPVINPAGYPAHQDDPWGRRPSSGARIGGGAVIGIMFLAAFVTIVVVIIGIVTH